MRPVRVVRLSDSCCVFHFAKNIAGKARLRVRGERGTEVRLIHAERLDAQGRADQSNIDVHYRPTDDSDPFQTDLAILSGGDDTFTPQFNYKGFQYVEVRSSRPLSMNAGSLTALEMHSDVPRAGEIRASNPTIVKMWRAACNSYLSNLFGYPTDCPQREKNGWTGDAHINVETGLYSFDAITVYEKWMRDHADEQRPDGVLPSIIPTAGWGYDWGNGPDWTSTVAIIPWQLYLFYGDATALRQMYPCMKLYVDHLAQIAPDGITDWGLGDWVPVRTQSDKRLTSSIYYMVDARIVARTARLLGFDDDARRYETLAERVREAINSRFLDHDSGLYCSGSQTELSAPLYWNVAPDTLREKVALRLYERVKANGFMLDVGLLGTKTILGALSDNGYAEAAFRMASQESFPSWGWWIANGATTFYENWRIDAENDISLNHIMFGEVGAWLFSGLGGIRPSEAAPGFRHILLRPALVEGLDSFSASHRSPYGEIVSQWKRQAEGRILYKAVIPPGSSASLSLPREKSFSTGGDTVELGSGKHEFTIL